MLLIFRSFGDLAYGRLEVDKSYYEAIEKMENMGVEPEYIVGWQGGFLRMPEREEQRVTEAYEAGYTDGQEKTLDNLENWVKK